MSPERLQKTHEALDREVASGRYSGYITMVTRNGKIADWHASGWQNVEEKIPMTKDSIIKIYSMTKVITSVAVLTLVEEGKVQLTDPVEKYFPVMKDLKVYTGGTADAPTLEPAKRPITVADLLTHTAGYYYDASWSADPIPGQLLSRAKIWEATSMDDFMARIATVPLHQQPGTRFRYGIHTDMLGAIVEKASGVPFAQFLQQRIFGPLGMRDTSFTVPTEKLARKAVVYGYGNGKLTPMPDLLPERGIPSGGGGLYSTAADYVRFAQMLLNGGELDGARIVSRKTVELMATDRIAHLADPHPFGQQDMGFGLGVRMMTNQGATRHLGSKGMFGWDGAATTLAWMDPKEKMVSILLTQHMPFNEGDIFATFVNGTYSALVD